MVNVASPVTVRHVGGDYSWAHPDPAALAACHFDFVARYLSPDPTKNLTLAEATALAALGISCVCNFESTATEAENGYAAGVADAQLARVQASAAGMPAGRPIYFSVDEDTVVGPHITGYFQGVQSVLGIGATGGYGDFTIVRQLLDAGLISWAWETTAWSGNPTLWDPRVHIRQVQQGLVIGGAQVDLDHGMADDIGQWTPGDEVTPQDIQAIVSALTPVIETQVANGVKYELTDENGEFAKALAGQATMETKLQQIAQGITDSYNNLAHALDQVPAAVTAAVVAELPAGTQVDAAALETTVENVVRALIAGASVEAATTARIVLPAPPAPPAAAAA